MNDGPRIWEGLCELDDTLAEHGVPRMSVRWREESRRFYLHPTARLWVVCAGRGAGKNLQGIKCSLAETLFGSFRVPPGERHYDIEVSETRDEATKTLAIKQQYLRFIGEPFSATTDTIELLNQPDRGFKVLACRVGAVSGWRAFGFTLQEVAKWNNEGVNPTKEVFASANAMTVTHPTARKRVFSSPMATSGDFFDMFERGNTDYQQVSQGSSWEFNDAITEQQTRELEPDDRVWRREYLGVPQAGALSAFDAGAITRAFAIPTTEGKPCQRIMVLDPSSGRADTWSFGIVGWNETELGGFICFDTIDGIEGSFWKQISGPEIVSKVAAIAKEHGVRHVHADQRESLMLEGAFAKHGLAYTVHDWTATSKPAAVERVRRWFADGAIALPDHDKLRRELLSFEERITPSGQFTFGGRGNSKDDYVALLITAAMADMADDIPKRGGGIPAPPRSGAEPPLDGHLRGNRWWGGTRWRRGF